MKTINGKALKGTIRRYYKYATSVFTMPTLDNDMVLGGNSFAVYAEYYGTGYPWHLFDNSTSTSFVPAARVGDIGDTYLIMYNPNELNITNITIQNRNYTTCTPREGSILASNDNANWTTLTTWTNDVTTALGTWDIDLSSNTGFYKYYKIQFTVWNYTSQVARAIAEIPAITATERIAVESTSSDYDYYLDLDEYKVVA